MKKVLIVINISKDESIVLAKEISSYLKEKGHETEFLSFDGFCDDTPFDGYDFVVTLGGDGTVLYAARNCVEFNIPIFPVNLGQFGFLANINKDQWKKEINLFLDGKAILQERSMLCAQLFRNNSKLYESLGLNDVVISAKNTARTVALNINYNNYHLCNLKSDGVIISTSTGSTAYSASAGGPIIVPFLDAFVLTPINSFSLSSRPIVLCSEKEIEINIQPCRTKEINMIVDGKEGETLLAGDKILINKLVNKVRIISSNEENYYNSLRSKLNWTGGPHA